MEEKKNKISLSTYILVLALLIIAVMAVFIYMQKVNANREIEGLKNDTEELKNTVAELQGKQGIISEVTSPNNTTDNVDNKNISALNIKGAIPDSNMNLSEFEEKWIEVFQSAWYTEDGNEMLIIGYDKRFCYINYSTGNKEYGTFTIEKSESIKNSGAVIILKYTSGKTEELGYVEGSSSYLESNEHRYIVDEGYYYGISDGDNGIFNK